MRKEVKTIQEASDYEERIYKIKGSTRSLDGFEKLLYTIQFLGNVGASRDMTVSIDGDGGARLRVKKDDNTKLMSCEVDTEGQINLSIE